MVSHMIVTHQSHDSFTLYQSWLVNNGNVIYGMKLPSRFQLIGQVHFKDYLKSVKMLADKLTIDKRDPITCRTYARYGHTHHSYDHTHSWHAHYSKTCRFIWCTVFKFLQRLLALLEFDDNGKWSYLKLIKLALSVVVLNVVVIQLPIGCYHN